MSFHTPARGQPWSFTKIADTSTIVPGTNVMFTGFNIPSIHQGIVGFAGFHSTPAPSTAGVYTGNGGSLNIIADRQTLSPGGRPFVGFAQGALIWPSMDAGQVAFNAGDGVEGGIFLRSGATITAVATNLTPVPNGLGGGFFFTNSPSLQNGRISFVGIEGSATGPQGAYSWQNGTLSVIADRLTPIPGGTGSFSGVYDLAVDNDSVVFAATGSGGQNGIYRAEPGGAVSRVYDTNIVVPGGNGGTFTGMARTALSAGHIAFYGQGGGQEGIYSDLSGLLTVIANHNTPVPGRPGQFFNGFGFTDIDNGVVAFTGVFGANRGVFSTHGGVLGKVLAQGDTLDGRIVLDTIIGSQGLSGDSLALYVEFTNGSFGIYRATIPGPGATLVVVAAGVMGCRRRRGVTLNSSQSGL